MTDIFDQAAELEARQREYWLKKQREKTEYSASAYECEECGEPIPEARRQAVIGCRCCIECQEEIEQYGKTRRAP
ncbi:conjugal transfer protein TraR [Neisseria sp. N95_16]|uniref:TraR/DksA family transcriptional regulator n=1 Tax=Neisseria brasiliensis TaxID=2666100 RepID=A0A5Q3RUZ2_9NEIS|nr:MULTISPECIES: TraR/DksA family transcriptional regulator [Neisseria]MRN37198.1 TraR/DksA family transcriptional regulator [Neisseria brasiliensis]PJO10083.1 conjugal transfer protein TraR [Neisseria sp. N95_16]PJO78747.1 conjugal transfer protein TraR [Neisseria sp. N177_16]QGL24207.1 TraR/DksA family transcriptional regulator [Neisseria brasiliensis]